MKFDEFKKQIIFSFEGYSSIAMFILFVIHLLKGDLLFAGYFIVCTISIFSLKAFAVREKYFISVILKVERLIFLRTEATNSYLKRLRELVPPEELKEIDHFILEMNKMTLEIISDKDSEQDSDDDRSDGNKPKRTKKKFYLPDWFKEFTRKVKLALNQA